MLKKRSLFPIVSILLAMPTFSYADANRSTSVAPIDNPIVLQRADPWLVRDDKTGCYTFIGTSPKFDEIELRQACRLNDLKLAEPKVIWHKNDKGPMSTNIWAPELHKVDGSWYIHFAAGDVEKPFSIRMFVLKNDSENPMDGQWQEMGQLKHTLIAFHWTRQHLATGKRYLVWAQQNQPATYNSALWIAEMDSPTSIKEPIVAITEPTLDWEVQGYKVNEGAAVMIREGKVLLTYSASATDHHYAMGLLWADADADLLDPASWHKKPQPIFASNES